MRLVGVGVDAEHPRAHRRTHRVDPLAALAVGLDQRGAGGGDALDHFLGGFAIGQQHIVGTGLRRRVFQAPGLPRLVINAKGLAIVFEHRLAQRAVGGGMHGAAGHARCSVLSACQNGMPTTGVLACATSRSGIGPAR
ncbi:hypothetical protein D3C72_1461140 [compost metagenome]